MINHIYIFGASGSGTTTLGRDLAGVLHYPHFDADHYFWLPTQPPFQQKRAKAERIAILEADLHAHGHWILSGSMPGWGDTFVPLFDLAVYLYIPHELRIERLKRREAKTFGTEAIRPGGSHYAEFVEFIEWASRYDEGGLDVRSRVLHEKWMQDFSCPILRMEGDISREERVQKVLTAIHGKKIT